MMNLVQPAKGRPGSVVINPWSYQSLGATLHPLDIQAGAAAAWPAAGLVIYVPFWVPEPMTVTNLYLFLGVAAGNGDMGVYDESGNLLVSTGSTVLVVTAGGQQFDVPDTKIARGNYYMAAVVDTVTTLTCFRNAAAAGICQALGLLEQASVTLPLSSGASPATFAVYTRAYIPLIAVQGYRTLNT
jgi:hypothetical protein